MSFSKGDRSPWYRFTDFIQAREQLRLRKDRDQHPWTEDPILGKFRFCNVRRRDDRVSRWIREAVIAPFKKAIHIGPWLALARHVNWPPTLRMILDNGYTPESALDWSAVGRLLDLRSEQGIKTWTGAYMVRAERTPDGKKGKYVCETVLQGMFENGDKMSALGIAIAEGKRQAVHSVLMSGYGWGSFMAGQVVDDWTWTYLLRDASDHYTWAPQGPGSVRGLKRLKDRPLNARYSEEEWLGELRHARAGIIGNLGQKFSDLTLMDVQNCLCEYDKYERVRLGEGRPRSIYKPERAY